MPSKRSSKDVIDVFSEDSVVSDVPARLHSFVTKWHGRIGMVRAQYAPKNQESWKFVPHYWRIERDMDQPNIDEICSKSIELVEQHALRSGMEGDVEGMRYRIVLYVRTDTGKELLKTCGLRVAYGDDGTAEFNDDVSEEKQNESVNFYRESMQDARDQTRQAQDFAMKLQGEYAKSVREMGEAHVKLLGEMQNMGSQISNIAQSIAAVTGASMQAITDASELYKASERKSTEIRKMEIEYEMAQLDNEASDRKFQASMDLVKQAAPLIMAQLLKVPPEAMQAMVAGASAKAMGMGEGGEGVEAQQLEASSEQTTEIAEMWVPPEKPPFDAKGRGFDEFDTREKVACFIYQLSAEQEIKVRTIVGMDIYDEIRAGSARGVIATEKALRRFNDSVQALEENDRMKRANELVNVLGQQVAMFFLGIAQSVV